MWMWFGVEALAATLTVCSSGCDHLSIQAAVDASASDDVIEVGPGTYYENVRVVHNLSLRSTDGPSVTVIDAEYADAGIYCDGAGVCNVDGFTIRNSRQDGGIPGSVGIHYNPSHASGGADIRNNYLIDNGAGIAIWNAGGGTVVIENNVITRSMYEGIGQSSGTMHVRNNAIYNNGGRGVDVDAIAVVENNILAWNGTGALMYRTEPTGGWNAMWGNGWDGTQGVSLKAGDGWLYYDGVDFTGVAPAGSDNLVAPPGWSTSACADERLGAGSLLIDAGNPDPAFNDLDGTRNDIGPYGGPGAIDELAVQPPVCGNVRMKSKLATNGGSLFYSIMLDNSSAVPVSADTNVVTVSSPTVRNLVGPALLTVPPGVRQKDLRLMVPMVFGSPSKVCLRIEDVSFPDETGFGCDVFVPTNRSVYNADLSGDNSVPAVVTSATGSAFTALDFLQSELFWYVSGTGLTSNITGVFIHEGAPGTDGPALFDITGELTQVGDEVVGSGVLALTSGERTSLMLGQLYINVYTDDVPTGEIRGQMTR